MKKRGIIVDDAQIMRMRLKDILSDEFEIVGEAQDGMQAIALCSQLQPDFITLDITMPHLDGIEALPRILAEHPDLKVVIVSAIGQKMLVLQALQIGAKDFVVKPFDAERVLVAVRGLVGTSLPPG
jgi:two-component system chemotaxis response regulator CheY